MFILKGTLQTTLKYTRIPGYILSICIIYILDVINSFLQSKIKINVLNHSMEVNILKHYSVWKLHPQDFECVHCRLRLRACTYINKLQKLYRLTWVVHLLFCQQLRIIFKWSAGSDVSLDFLLSQMFSCIFAFSCQLKISSLPLQTFFCIFPTIL